MTQDFFNDAIEACDREQVPYVFAMRAGHRGSWRVAHDLTHHDTRGEPIPPERDILDMLELMLSEDER